MRTLTPAGLLLVATAPFFGSGCDPVEALPQLPDDQIDLFEQRAAARSDILWVIDNSSSMAAEQQKLAARFANFFGRIVEAGVDHHIGVVTTDPADNGILRAFSGSVPGCDRCTILTPAVGCLDASGASDANCDIADVFADLVQPGIDGSSFEEGFAQATAALDGRNEGFLRDDAALFVVFVSDEDEGALQDGEPVRRVQRQLESLKPPGDENLVTVAAISGWPAPGDQPPVPIEALCEVLSTTFDSDPANDDARAGATLEAMRNRGGCIDASDDDGAVAFAEVGGRYFELACRTGGVVADLCAGDYGDALDALGANAAGLVRSFPISAADRTGGDDCTFFAADDDAFIDCDGDGSVTGAVDGPLCVTAQCVGDDAPSLQPRGVWVWEAGTSSVRFSGGCVPAPGTAVQVQYALLPGGSTCR